MRNLFLLCLVSFAFALFFITENDLFFTKNGVQAISFGQSKSASAQLEFSQRNNLPNSLRLTQIDGQLEVDDEGNLVISAQVKNLFDYFLMTLGEESLEEILTRINAHLAKNLQEPALSQAQSILTQYLEYKNNMVTLNQSYSDEAGFLGEFEMLQRQLDMQTRLRRETMEPDVVEAFFKFDEVYDQWSLERLKVGADDSLSFDERKQRLSQMEQDLPEEIRVLQEGKYQPQAFRQLQNTQTFSSEEEKYSFYQQQLGDDAAQRLQLLDSRRQQWQARLDDYFEKKGAILSVEGLDQADKESEVRELTEASFSDNEQRRLAALEDMAQPPIN